MYMSYELPKYYPLKPARLLSTNILSISIYGAWAHSKAARTVPTRASSKRFSNLNYFSSYKPTTRRLERIRDNYATRGSARGSCRLGVIEAQWEWYGSAESRRRLVRWVPASQFLGTVTGHASWEAGLIRTRTVARGYETGLSIVGRYQYEIWSMALKDLILF